jgi:hypothetical protein
MTYDWGCGCLHRHTYLQICRVLSFALQCRSEAPLVGGAILKSVWNFIVKHEFWFCCLIIMGLYVGEYQTGETWMASLAFVMFLIAVTRLASHPMWKKDEE